MSFTNFDNIRYYSKLFRFSPSKLREMLRGIHGENKQLLAYTIVNFERAFVENIVNDVEMIKLQGVEYFEIKVAEDIFGYKRNTLKDSVSKEKIYLKNCLLNTPVCFTANIKAYLITMHSVNAIFASPKRHLSSKRYFL